MRKNIVFTWFNLKRLHQQRKPLDSSALSFVYYNEPIEEYMLNYD